MLADLIDAAAAAGTVNGVNGISLLVRMLPYDLCALHKHQAAFPACLSNEKYLNPKAA